MKKRRQPNYGTMYRCAKKEIAWLRESDVIRRQDDQKAFRTMYEALSLLRSVGIVVGRDAELPEGIRKLIARKDRES